VLVHVGLDPVQDATESDTHHDSKMNNVVAMIFMILSFVPVESSIMHEFPFLAESRNPVIDDSSNSTDVFAEKGYWRNPFGIFL